MKRRGFLAALLGAPVAAMMAKEAKVQPVPVPVVPPVPVLDVTNLAATGKDVGYEVEYDFSLSAHAGRSSVAPGNQRF